MKIAHEIRNPLGSIELFANMISEDLKEGIHGDYARRISSSVKMLRNTLENMLSFTRGITPKKTFICLNELIDEIIKEFDIKRISKSPSKFDINKLNWLNSEYIKEIDRDVLLKKLKLFLDKSYFCNYDKNTLDRILILSSGGIQYFEQINDNVKIFFDDSFNLSDEYLKNNQSLIKLFYNKVSSINNINKDMWKEIVKEIGKELSLKGKELFMPVRVITTGQEHGPDIYEVLDILGKDRVLKRIERFIR
jgi:glutamyl/glutaminyl-tRNA synthetase